MGLLPVLATRSEMAARSLFRMISPDAGKISPGIMLAGSSANWIVNGHELGAVDERCLHFHLVNHFGDAFHDLIAAKNLAAFGHELGNGLAVARAFHDKICDQGDAFGII